MNNENEIKSSWDNNSSANNQGNNDVNNNVVPIDNLVENTTSDIPVVASNVGEVVESTPLINPALTIEQPKIENPVESPIVEDPSNKEIPVKGGNSNKSGIVLFILFILLMIFVWMLPDVADKVKEYMNKNNEKEYQDKLEKLDDEDETEGVVEPDLDKDKILTKTCTMSVVDNNFITNKTIELSYSNDKLQTYKQVEVTDYALDEIVYNDKLNLCNLFSNNFTNKDGYTHVCSSNNNILTITKTFVLEDFKEVKQTIENVEYSVVSNYKLDDKIEDVISNLASQGAVCK